MFELLIGLSIGLGIVGTIEALVGKKNWNWYCYCYAVRTAGNYYGVAACSYRTCSKKSKQKSFMEVVV